MCLVMGVFLLRFEQFVGPEPLNIHLDFGALVWYFGSHWYHFGHCARNAVTGNKFQLANVGLFG